MRILYVGPFCGELGWEIGNWVPHYRYIRAHSGPFDKVIVHCKPGHELFYDADHILPINNINEGQVECNAFLREHPEQYKAYKTMVAEAKEHVERLKHAGNKVTPLFLPTEYYRVAGFKHKRWELLHPDKETLEKWQRMLPDDFVLVPVRAYGRSAKKNTNYPAYEVVAKWAEDHRIRMVTVGKQYPKASGVKPCPPWKALGINLMGKTTLVDLVALLRMARLAVGSSTGPLHLAAQVGCPHVVWGGGFDAVRKRYEGKWNKLGVHCEHIGLRWAPDMGKLERAMTRAYEKPNPCHKRTIAEDGDE